MFEKSLKWVYCALTRSEEATIMATRRELQERREKLRQWLIESCNNGTLKPGSMLPPVRGMASEYGISASSAFEIVRELAEDGLLYSQQGAGTFVGRQPTRDDLFLLVLPDEMENRAHAIAIRNGFESFLTRRGGTCLTLNFAKARAYQENRQLEGLVGVGEVCWLAGKESWEGPESYVVLREVFEESRHDMVYFDDEDAGWKATQHLLSLGHRGIAFLGVHQLGIAYAGGLDWSRQREKGWRHALEQAGCDASNLSFCPPAMPGNWYQHLHEAGHIIGRELALRLQENICGITAVVVSNSLSAQQMFEALWHARINEDRWPVVVSFDDYTTDHDSLLSVLRPSWEELGRQGAALLWERGQGHLEAAPQQRPVRMQLIPRFSCRPRRFGVPLPTDRFVEAIAV